MVHCTEVYTAFLYPIPYPGGYTGIGYRTSKFICVSLRTMTPPLTLTSTTAMQMLPLSATTSVEHRGGIVPPDPHSLGQAPTPRISSFCVCARVPFCSTWLAVRGVSTGALRTHSA